MTFPSEWQRKQSFFFGSNLLVSPNLTTLWVKQNSIYSNCFIKVSTADSSKELMLISKMVDKWPSSIRAP